ncbi:MAG: hypothetical protein LBL42_02250 [Tannerella sp.]|nr:hypothetical protein [Tannerella sp.]
MGIGDFQAETDNFQAEISDFQAETGDFQAGIGDFQAETGNFQVETDNFQAEIGNFLVGDCFAALAKTVRAVVPASATKQSDARWFSVSSLWNSV